MPSISYDGSATPIFLIVSPRTSRRQSSQRDMTVISTMDANESWPISRGCWMCMMTIAKKQPVLSSVVTTAYHFVWTRKCFHFLPHVTFFKYRHVRHSLNNMDSKQVVTDRFKSQWLVQADWYSQDARRKQTQKAQKWAIRNKKRANKICSYFHGTQAKEVVEMEHDVWLDFIMWLVET